MNQSVVLQTTENLTGKPTGFDSRWVKLFEIFITF